MKILIGILLVLLFSVVHAQVSSLPAIYNKIPKIQDKLLCESAETYIATIQEIDLLFVQIEEMKHQLNQDLQTNNNKTDNTIQSLFPTDEELKQIEKLSEEEQQAFWEKIEAKDAEIEQTIANNRKRFQTERDSLNEQLAAYQTELLEIVEEFSEIHYAAMKVKSDKMQKINETCIGSDNNLTEYGKEQIGEIKIEYCEIVSDSYLKWLKYEYSWLEKIININKRLTIIDLMEFSTLNEKEVFEQNYQLIALNELEIIEQFIINYKELLSFLPSDLDDKI